jgi:glycerol-3-phosphate dehydrogenase
MNTLRARDLTTLAPDVVDLLVVGGGIYGLTVATDAAQRGLSVALVERNDFGSGTSFNHLRTIHGGLRYLQTLDLARARESVRERRTLARIAPWAVAPLPFILPLDRSLARGAAAMRAGFLLDRIVASDRNDGLPASHRLPAGTVLNADAARAICPELEGRSFPAAARWYDYVTVEADRLTFSWALAAIQAGARLMNYVEATALLAAGGRVAGADLVDRVTGQAARVAARAVVNATGTGLNRLLAPFGADVPLPLLQASNIVTDRPAPTAAIGGRSHSGRNLFLVPWRGRALFGTWESATTRQPDDVGVDEGELAAFLVALTEAFPSFRLTRANVTLVHRGIVPARLRAGSAPTLDGGELVFEHRAEGLAGLISVAGTKYTTARAVAEGIVDRLVALLERDPIPCRSADTPLPHVELTGDDLLRHAAAHEMVVTLADAVVRRTALGALGCPDADTLAHAAAVVGDTLGWSSTRRAEEIAALRGMY